MANIERRVRGPGLHLKDDFSGHQFGRLKVLRVLAERKRGRVQWECECRCGSVVAVVGDQLKRGVTRSCGCLQRDIVIARNSTHGQRSSGSRHRAEYSTWCRMIGRCTQETNADYSKYGGRGITVCDRWLNNFPAFLADMGQRPPGLTLERIDNNGNYEPGNCAWATWLRQKRNRRCSIHVVINGQQMALMEACELFGVSYVVAARRRTLGWPEERWFEPVKRRT